VPTGKAPITVIIGGRALLMLIVARFSRPGSGKDLLTRAISLLTGPYNENDPFHERLVTYAYLAGVTKNLGLTTGVTIVPQRQTALFAKTGCGC
jgi:hypothetical protein